MNTDTKHLIRGMLLMRDVSLTKLAEILNENFGYTFTQPNLSRKINSDTMKWSELRDIAATLGYTIRISPLENWEGFDSKNIKNNVNLIAVL